jgi:hypothetical protein
VSGDPDPAEISSIVWSRLNSAFSRPIGPNDSAESYRPTQVLAATFKEQGFDGLAYTSSLDAGLNIMLYDLSDAYVEKRQLVRVESVRWEIAKVGDEV